MPQSSDSFGKILAGEVATIENVKSLPLSISLTSENGSNVKLELLPGQVLGFSAGDANAELVLHDGDVAGLQVIKPALAS